jgi:hypothetical protein
VFHPYLNQNRSLRVLRIRANQIPTILLALPTDPPWKGNAFRIDPTDKKRQQKTEKIESSNKGKYRRASQNWTRNWFWQISDVSSRNSFHTLSFFSQGTRSLSAQTNWPISTSCATLWVKNDILASALVVESSPV